MDEDAWEDLLSFIEERRVIPIIGPELPQVATERGPRLLMGAISPPGGSRDRPLMDP